MKLTDSNGIYRWTWKTEYSMTRDTFRVKPICIIFSVVGIHSRLSHRIKSEDKEVMSLNIVVGPVTDGSEVSVVGHYRSHLAMLTQK